MCFTHHKYLLYDNTLCIFFVVCRLTAATEKLDSEQDKHRKEERLMISAVYEVRLCVNEVHRAPDLPAFIRHILTITLSYRDAVVLYCACVYMYLCRWESM